MWYIHSCFLLNIIQLLLVQECVTDSSSTAGRQLYACVRAFCPSGVSTTSCVSVRSLLPHSDVTGDVTLYDVDGHSPDMPLMKELAHSKYHDGHLEILRKNELDFATSSLQLVGLLTGCEGLTVEWYLMTRKMVPQSTCDVDEKCVQSVVSSNGIATFHTTLIDSRVYFICAKSNQTEVSREHLMETLDSINVCSNGVAIDDTPPHAGHVTITNAVDGYLVDSSEMLLHWADFSDNSVHLTDSYLSGIASYEYAVGK
jgi:hypothetical protein